MATAASTADTAASVPLDDTPALLARLAGGRDAAAWEALVLRHAASMRRAAVAVTGRTALADDAVQEALLQVRDRARLFRPPDADPARAAGAWLRRVAATCALQLLRAERRRTRHERAAKDAAMPSPTPSAQHVLEDAEQRTHVMQALAALPDHHREPIVLHLLVGLDHAGVGERLGCSAATARVRLHRGLHRLRAALGVRATPAALALLGAAPLPDAPPHAEALALWRSLVSSPASPRLSQHAVFGATHRVWPLLILMLLGLCTGALVWSADTVHASTALPASARHGAPPHAVQPTPSLARALHAQVDLVLRTDTLLEVAQLLDAQLPPGAAVRWGIPVGLRDSSTHLLTGIYHGRLQSVLDAIARSQGWAWVSHGDQVIWSQPADPAARTSLAAALDAARRAHDADAWSSVADDILATGDLELRAILLHTIADPDPAIAAIARLAALRIGDEGVAAGLPEDADAGAGMIRWLKDDVQISRDRRFWLLWIDCRPAGGWPVLLAVADAALRGMKTPAGLVPSRPAALALAAAATCATASGLHAVAERVHHCPHLDVALEALCVLAQRHEPQALADVRALADGTIDPARWSAWTDAHRDPTTALLAVRERPGLHLVPGWWRRDPRFGEHGVVEKVATCPFDPLYQEPAISALIAGRDAHMLDLLHGIVRQEVPIDRMPTVRLQVRNIGTIQMHTGDFIVRVDRMAQAMAWLAAAGEAPDRDRLLRLVDAYECWDPSGFGAPDLLLRLVRSGFPLPEADRSRLAHGLFVQAQSLGGMLEVGANNDCMPWFAGFDGLTDHDLVHAITTEIARPDYRQLIAGGSSGIQYGFPIYQHLTQALAAMRTEEAITALVGATPHWVQQQDAGLCFWYEALGLARDPACTRQLLAAVQRPSPAGTAVAALTLTRDPAAAATIRTAAAGLRGRERLWYLANLSQGGPEWMPQATVATFADAADMADPEVSRLGMDGLSDWRTHPRDAEGLTAAVAAVQALLTHVHGPPAIASLAVAALARPGWPLHLQLTIAQALAAIMRGEGGGALQQTAAKGLASMRTDPRVAPLLQSVRAAVTDPTLRTILAGDGE